LDIPPLDDFTTEEGDGLRKHLDPYPLLCRYKSGLKSEALIQAYFRADNYREFRVGAAVLACNGTDYRIFGGANMMFGKGHQKACAEQQAIKAAYLAGYTEILVICVVGRPQPDDKSGLVSPTLHPCEDCRKLFKSLYRMSDDVLICTFTFEKDGPSELHTLHGLIKKHNKHRAA
jgi:cytidine deaminase